MTLSARFLVHGSLVIALTVCLTRTTLAVEISPADAPIKAAEKPAERKTGVFVPKPGPDDQPYEAEPREKSAAPSDLPRLPEPISSFGGAAYDGWLYVYSGHTGNAHAHSKKNLSNRFARLKIDGAGQKWETLPAETALQSVALVPHGGYLYRVGGLAALNAPGEKENLISSAEFARFNPKSKEWKAQKPLPEPRSSHDAVVVGDVLYVVGGWNLNGPSKDWKVNALSLDLSKPDSDWVVLAEQPFKRRALAAASWGKRIYAIGGMTADNKPSLEVDYYDIAEKKWSKGPALPGEAESMNGFGTSACEVDGRLIATTLDGKVHRLSADGSKWEPIGALQTGRFFHRLLPTDKAVLAIGGASHSAGHLDSIERFKLDKAAN